MLTIFNQDRRIGRRAFMQVGSLALGGLTLPGLLATRARAAEAKRLVKDKSVIFLFLHGGPSQTETFDPKMSAPAGIRSATGAISTKLPGVTFASSFPRLAARPIGWPSFAPLSPAMATTTSSRSSAATP